MPMWAVLDEYELDVVDERMHWPGIAVLWVFVFLSNVILVNLLIALMSDTFAKVKAQAHHEWRFEFVQRVIEHSKPQICPIPPPFTCVYFFCAFRLHGEIPKREALLAAIMGTAVFALPLFWLSSWLVAVLGGFVGALCVWVVLSRCRGLKPGLVYNEPVYFSRNDAQAQTDPGPVDSSYHDEFIMTLYREGRQTAARASMYHDSAATPRRSETPPQATTGRARQSSALFATKRPPTPLVDSLRI
eukprot:CAMPEP_0181228612 /NCGR_PEP_ID=MMETSP1096-20121128/33441_1 /TAXON_ID=156174 ORGANISM="Chrysochromulina ericina, Strain CCMP281" /NCGR_SAMPLE_ID=MMETSP1096 /ASSEMBLY_ACC=CAM_ASM_000453 /LENGTH=244 /DNA_ID=CAMNT_0023322149 /DNA_START=34 /DNA_END=768 /DNA_ORIENTATION=-